MLYWVYVSKSRQDILTIALSQEITISLSKMEQSDRIVYLRPFMLSFDALAHKHLLADLSKSSMSFLIKKNRKETEQMLRSLMDA